VAVVLTCVAVFCISLGPASWYPCVSRGMYWSFTVHTPQKTHGYQEAGPRDIQKTATHVKYHCHVHPPTLDPA